jgi:hypothetical protein
MRFVWQGEAFQFRVLLFGLSLSPWIFTMVVRFLVKMARARGIRIFAYLDDWLILTSSSQVCRDHTMFVISLARELGFVVNLEKLELIPSRTFRFLGMMLDTVRWLASPNPERIDALLSLIVRLSSQASALARTLFSLLGMMESMANLLPLGRVHKRPFQRAVAARWSQESGSWDDLMVLGPWFRESVAQWTQLDWVRSAVPFWWGPPLLEIFTDASMEG